MHFLLEHPSISSAVYNFMSKVIANKTITIQEILIPGSVWHSLCCSPFEIMPWMITIFSSIFSFTMVEASLMLGDKRYYLRYIYFVFITLWLLLTMIPSFENVCIIIILLFILPFRQPRTLLFNFHYWSCRDSSLFDILVGINVCIFFTWGLTSVSKPCFIEWWPLTTDNIF